MRWLTIRRVSTRGRIGHDDGGDHRCRDAIWDPDLGLPIDEFGGARSTEERVEIRCPCEPGDDRELEAGCLIPTDHGYEATIAQRMAARAEARAAGRPRRDPNPKPTVSGSGDVMRTREANRRRLAATEKQDASG